MHWTYELGLATLAEIFFLSFFHYRRRVIPPRPKTFGTRCCCCPPSARSWLRRPPPPPPSTPLLPPPTSSPPPPPSTSGWTSARNFSVSEIKKICSSFFSFFGMFYNKIPFGRPVAASRGSIYLICLSASFLSFGTKGILVASFFFYFFFLSTSKRNCFFPVDTMIHPSPNNARVSLEKGVFLTRGFYFRKSSEEARYICFI